MKSFLKAASLVALLAASGGAAVAQSGPAAIDGRWDAVISHNGIDVPFRLDISGEGQSLKGTFYDGFAPYDGTTSASFQDGKLTLNIEHYLTTIYA
jgi:opacity protein-like surface antigen